MPRTCARLGDGCHGGQRLLGFVGGDHVGAFNNFLERLEQLGEHLLALLALFLVFRRAMSSCTEFVTYIVCLVKHANNTNKQTTHIVCFV